MKVRELLETNGFIGDITIEIRGDSTTVTLGYEQHKTFSKLHQDWHIGANEGIKPPYPSKVGVYIPENINARDDGADYYELHISKIPKELLELNVRSWHVRKSYRRGIYSSQFTEILEHVIIWAWTDETLSQYEQQEELKRLQRAATREERQKQKAAETEEQLDGQLSLTDMLDD